MPFATMSADAKRQLLQAALRTDMAARLDLLKQLGIEIDNADFSQLLDQAVGEGESVGEVRRILGAWIEHDAATAANWVLSLPEGVVYQQAVQQVAARWGRRAPREATAWMEALPPGTPRDRAVAGFVRSAVGEEPELAARWYDKIDDEELRRSVASTVSAGWARTEPEAAAEWVEALPEGTARDRAAYGLLTAAHRGDPMAALKWVNLIENKEMWTPAFASLMGVWAGKNAAEAAEIINVLPEGETRDMSVQRYAFFIVHQSPEQIGRAHV